MKKSIQIISLFSGAGGLDLGFTNKGFEVVFANDIDKDSWETFEKNHNHQIDRRSIVDVPSEEIPSAEGILGGPPCQSWSLAGSMKGINDNRGKLFYEYLRILRDKKPLFFLAENVAGIVSKTHIPEFLKIIEEFENLGYSVSWKLLNSKNYGVPQERKRVIIIGYRKDLNKTFDFDNIKEREIISLKEAIGDLPKSKEAKEKNKPNKILKISNHEHMNGGFSTIYLSRNRRKNWEDPSFTIQAGGRHAPLHPDSTKMIKIGKDNWEFEDGENSSHRRLSVRECARVQTFPDDFIFYYDNVSKGYKLIGNAVPVKLAEVIAEVIAEDLKEII
ncbi:MAG: DNA cytosine methyltransferase [Nanoarchaeota archaeon]|nr:DNA cytosine methyltransferase [Nanoarchaeota archaeon]MBU1028466.1 DNA cytosine methyltransferase [Nanoarchaeota archaeon]